MHVIVNFLFVVLLVMAGLLAVRFVVHRFFPGWGTTWAGVIGGAGALLDQIMGGLPAVLTDAQGLPWTKVLDSTAANAVVFGFAAAMVVLRNIPRKAGA